MTGRTGSWKSPTECVVKISFRESLGKLSVKQGQLIFPPGLMTFIYPGEFLRVAWFLQPTETTVTRRGLNERTGKKNFEHGDFLFWQN
ncbi:hypothetical protein TWF225_007172 [Orbilia oligospora]|uniref:Uncharacterized protein n=1 Tax=Orbilia oligospora TaxID=2813651 RepID=A0A7C8PDG7_ORBOL|nr:hypothetical protein TWF751_004122 [Orbilia oligospora]KAF3180810.1 hypothetical protein TWF225_007172 [Orbilia oligospora]KAF3234861.1 hypothetical protein TWF128_002215 [Orbilia oligospora]KAF3251716.1 hypothetical protein TWF217_008043 [Orbilia oligospora]KAF3287232.1 hypothetical protein TWF132_008602 [Orbilia oligospora]